MQKTVLGYMRGVKNYLKKFELRPSTFTENCAWLSREKIFLRNFRPRVNIFQKSVLGIVEGQILLIEILSECLYFYLYVCLVIWKGFETFLRNFYVRPRTFREKCAWLYEGV